MLRSELLAAKGAARSIGAIGLALAEQHAERSVLDKHPTLGHGVDLRIGTCLGFGIGRAHQLHPLLKQQGAPFRLDETSAHAIDVHDVVGSGGACNFARETRRCAHEHALAVHHLEARARVNVDRWRRRRRRNGRRYFGKVERRLAADDLACEEGVGSKLGLFLAVARARRALRGRRRAPRGAGRGRRAVQAPSTRTRRPGSGARRAVPAGRQDGASARTARRRARSRRGACFLRWARSAPARAARRCRA